MRRGATEVSSARAGNCSPLFVLGRLSRDFRGCTLKKNRENKTISVQHTFVCSYFLKDLFSLYFLITLTHLILFGLIKFIKKNKNIL